MTDFPKLVLPGDEKAQTAPESRDAELEAARAALNAELELRAAGTAVPQAAPVDFCAARVCDAYAHAEYPGAHRSGPGRGDPHTRGQALARGAAGRRGVRQSHRYNRFEPDTGLRRGGAAEDIQVHRERAGQGAHARPGRGRRADDAADGPAQGLHRRGARGFFGMSARRSRRSS